MQLCCSAMTAEAMKLSNPATIHSRSTECHNQDKVSMGTIAARDCLRILELTEQVGAGLLVAVRQGAWLRRKMDPSLALQAPLEQMLERLGADIPVVEEDRRLEPDLRLLLERIGCRAWKLYD
jgi:histidine ammonia-lyase